MSVESWIVPLALVPLALVPLAALLLALGPARAAEQGVSADRIVFGQATALEGPSAALGRAARDGILAAFGEVDADGGVGGRKLVLVSRNDGYEPEVSVAVTRQLIEDDHVFALIGALGTSPSMATVPIAREAGVPFVGPFTGADFLRDPENFNVVNLHPSYFEEAQFAIDHLVEDRGITRIGVFYQDDSFGRAGLAGLTRAFDKHGLKPVAEGSFVRNTLAVKVALATIRKANPQAVIMVAPYRPCAEFVKLAHRLDFAPLFVGNSFTGLDALARDLGPLATGIFLPESVPIPQGQTRPAARYRAALAAVDPKAAPDSVGFEGYFIGRLIIAALRAAGDQPTRTSFLAAIFGHRFDIDGVVFDFSRHDSNEAVPHLTLAVIGANGQGKTVAGMNQQAR